MKVSKFLTVVAAAILLNGCGQGGSNSASTNNNTTNETPEQFAAALDQLAATSSTTGFDIHFNQVNEADIIDLGTAIGYWPVTHPEPQSGATGSGSGSASGSLPTIPLTLFTDVVDIIGNGNLSADASTPAIPALTGIFLNVTYDPTIDANLDCLSAAEEALLQNRQLDIVATGSLDPGLVYFENQVGISEGEGGASASASSETDVPSTVGSACISLPVDYATRYAFAVLTKIVSCTLGGPSPSPTPWPSPSPWPSPITDPTACPDSGGCAPLPIIGPVPLNNRN